MACSEQKTVLVTEKLEQQNVDFFFRLRKRHSKTAGSETSGGPEEGELVPTKKKSRREQKNTRDNNLVPRVHRLHGQWFSRRRLNR